MATAQASPVKMISSHVWTCTYPGCGRSGLLFGSWAGSATCISHNLDAQNADCCLYKKGLDNQGLVNNLVANILGPEYSTYGEDAKITGVLSNGAKLDNDKTPGTLTGKGMMALLNILNRSRDIECFVDLGSGVGNILIAVFLVFAGRVKVVGVESEATPFCLAERVLKAANSELQPRFGDDYNVNNHHLDGAQLHTVLPSGIETLHIFWNNAAFIPETMNRMQDYLLSLKEMVPSLKAVHIITTAELAFPKHRGDRSLTTYKKTFQHSEPGLFNWTATNTVTTALREYSMCTVEDEDKMSGPLYNHIDCLRSMLETGTVMEDAVTIFLMGYLTPHEQQELEVGHLGPLNSEDRHGILSVVVGHLVDGGGTKALCKLCSVGFRTTEDKQKEILLRCIKFLCHQKLKDWSPEYFCNTGSEYINKHVILQHGDQEVHATVSCYDSEQNWYKIIHEDGDKEDLEEHEVRKGIEKYQQKMRSGPAIRAVEEELQRVEDQSVEKQDAVEGEPVEAAVEATVQNDEAANEPVEEAVQAGVDATCADNFDVKPAEKTRTLASVMKNAEDYKQEVMDYLEASGMGIGELGRDWNQITDADLIKTGIGFTIDNVEGAIDTVIQQIESEFDQYGDLTDSDLSLSDLSLSDGEYEVDAEEADAIEDETVKESVEAGEQAAEAIVEAAEERSEAIVEAGEQAAEAIVEAAEEAAEATVEAIVEKVEEAVKSDAEADEEDCAANNLELTAAETDSAVADEEDESERTLQSIRNKDDDRNECHLTDETNGLAEKREYNSEIAVEEEELMDPMDTSERYEQASFNFESGNTVEADWDKKGTYFMATVTGVNANGTYRIQYVDGETENNVLYTSMRICSKRERAITKRDPDTVPSDKKGLSFAMGSSGNGNSPRMTARVAPRVADELTVLKRQYKDTYGAPPGGCRANDLTWLRKKIEEGSRANGPSQPEAVKPRAGPKESDERLTVLKRQYKDTYGAPPGGCRANDLTWLRKKIEEGSRANGPSQPEAIKPAAERAGRQRKRRKFEGMTDITGRISFAHDPKHTRKSRKEDWEN